MTDKTIKLTENPISLDNLKALSDELKRIMNKKFKVLKYEECCIILVETIIEYLIHGDKNDPLIFDRFCEYDIMNDFIVLSNQNYRTINMQIIKSLALLLANLTNKQSLFFLLSNNFINQIISNDYINDEDFLSYYVNFLKSLSIRIDSSTVQLFFHPQINTFPLLTQALKLYNHPDPMIYNTVRNVFLSLLRINYEPIIDYISSLPTINFFLFMVCRLRDMIKELDQLINEDANEQVIKGLYEDIINDIMFFQDIFSLKIEKITYMLINSLLYYVILPLLGRVLFPESNETISISIYVSIYMFTILFHHIHDETFINSVYSILFFPILHKDLIRFIHEIPINPMNYTYKWVPKKKNYLSWILKKTFIDYVMENFSEAFIRGMLFDFNSSFVEIKTIIKKLENKYSGHNTGIDSTSDEIYKAILNELAILIPKEKTMDISKTHKNISHATGIQIGLSFREWKHSPIHLLKKTLKTIQKAYTKDIDTTTFVPNIISKNIFVLLKANDDSLILLVNLLIKEINEKVTSKEILSYTQMLPFSKLKSHQSGDDNSNDLTDNIKMLDIGMLVNKTKKDYRTEEVNFRTLPGYSKQPDFNEQLTMINNQIISNYLIDNQHEYNKELSISLAKLLLTEPTFRSITQKLIIYNLSYIIPKEVIDKELLNIIKKGFDNSIDNIKTGLLNHKVIILNGAYLFETEWEAFKLSLPKILRKILNNPFLIVPICIESFSDNLPAILYKKNTPIDMFLSDLAQFMTLYEFLRTIGQMTNSDSLITSFPIRTICSFKKYSIGQDILLSDTNHSDAICHLLIKGNEVSEPMTIIQYQNYLMLGIQNNDETTCRIKFIYALSLVEITVDLTKPRILGFIIFDTKHEVTFSASFEEINELVRTKNFIEEQKNMIVELEYKAITNYINSFPKYIN